MLREHGYERFASAIRRGDPRHTFGGQPAIEDAREMRAVEDDRAARTTEEIPADDVDTFTARDEDVDSRRAVASACRSRRASRLRRPRVRSIPSESVRRARRPNGATDRRRAEPAASAAEANPCGSWIVR